MLSRYKGIIFDLDGTIVDTVPVWKEFFKNFVAPHSFDFFKATRRKIEGAPDYQNYMALYMLLNPKISSPEFALEYFNLIQKHFSLASIQFIPGFETFFDQYVKNKFQVAIATNCATSVLSVLRRRYLEKFTNNIFNTTSFPEVALYLPLKPSPSIYIQTLKRMGLQTHEAIAIEDSQEGYEAATSAGLDCIIIGKPIDKNAKLIVPDYYELIKAINEHSN